MTKNLTLVIKANQDFIRHATNSDIKENAPLLNLFFESISNIYLPLLRMIEKLEAQNVPCRFGIVLPPVLCTLLSDSELKKLYVSYLEKRNDLGKKELRRNAGNESIIQQIKAEIAANNTLKDEFVNKYHENLVEAYADCARKGYIELLGTCGTDIFMPHYADIKEVISAQIECGLHSYRQSFGTTPEGFWIPDFGYFPSVEKLVRSYGYTYTILDTRSVLLAETVPQDGIFYPSRTDNSLVIFARDKQIDSELFGEDGFVFKPVYRNQNRDIGFELPIRQLSPIVQEGSIRYSTGYKYWNRCFDNEKNSIYDSEKALKQVKDDALTFIKKRSEVLDKASQLLQKDDFVTCIVTLGAEKLFGKWHEAISWLEEVFCLAKEYNLNVTTCDKQCEKQYSLEKIQPYYSAASGAGYGENLLSSKNCWMMRYIRKACERMVDLSNRFTNDTGLKTRLLNLGAKELMIAQNLHLAKMINHSELPEFAEKRFKESISSFTAVFDSLGSNTVSTEWLTTLEVEDSMFPWMNYRIFSKKR